MHKVVGLSDRACAGYTALQQPYGYIMKVEVQRLTPAARTRRQ